MPSANTQKTRQRSRTPTRQKQVKIVEDELAADWTSGHGDLFKQPAVFSPRRTRPSTRRQSVYVQATTKLKVSTKKPKSPVPNMARLKQTSTIKESRSDKKRSTLKSPPTGKKVTRARSSSRSRSMTPSRVRKERSASPQKKADSKIPVKARARSPAKTSPAPRERTPSRRTTPSRSVKSPEGRTTPSRSTRSRTPTRAVTPLSKPSGRKTPITSSKKLKKKPTPTRGSTPSRRTPSRQEPASASQKPKKRTVTPGRSTITPPKAAKLLGKTPQIVTPAAVAGTTPQTSTPARGGGRKRPAEIPLSEIRFSKRLAARGEPNTSLEESQLKSDLSASEGKSAEDSNGWSWCAIL